MQVRAFVFVLIVVVGFGCKPKEPVQPVNPTNPVATEEFSVLIDGVKWTPNTFTARSYLTASSSHSGHDTVLYIEANNTVQDQRLSFSIEGEHVKVGSYNTPGGGNDYLLSFYFDSSLTSSTQGKYYKVSGSLIITQITTDHIKGAFNASMKEYLYQKPMLITNGVFNIPYKPL